MAQGVGETINFHTRLIQLVRSGLPLPLALIGKRRSLLSLAHLADLVQPCTQRPPATEQPLLAADAHVSGCLARPSHFPALLELATSPLVLRGFVTRLIRSLQLSHSTAIELAAWAPRLTRRGTKTGAVTQT